MGNFTSRLTLARSVSRAPPPEVGPFEKFIVDPELEPFKASEAAYTDKTYLVLVYSQEFYGMAWTHLAVRRHDHKTIRDHWAVLQLIKNQILGPEAEAAELYPAQGRLVDVEHTYHLWSPIGQIFPFGFMVGMYRRYEYGRCVKRGYPIDEVLKDTPLEKS
jgi:hypothetical protein